MTSQFPIPDLNGLNPEVFHPSQTWQAQYLINNRQTHSKALTFAAAMPPLATVCVQPSDVLKG